MFMKKMYYSLNLVGFQGLVHPKLKILSLITQLHVVPNPLDMRSSPGHKQR